MDEYAKQQIVAFQKFTNATGWFWAPNRWVNYNGEPISMTTEELYERFLNTLTPKP